MGKGVFPWSSKCDLRSSPMSPHHFPKAAFTCLPPGPSCPTPPHLFRMVSFPLDTASLHQVQPGWCQQACPVFLALPLLAVPPQHCPILSLSFLTCEEVGQAYSKSPYRFYFGGGSQ